jgi:hypothetical protein
MNSTIANFSSLHFFSADDNVWVTCRPPNLAASSAAELLPVRLTRWLERKTGCSLTMLAASIDVSELQRKQGFQVAQNVRAPKQPHLNSEPVRAIALESNQLGELGRDICHRIFCSVQAAS